MAKTELTAKQRMFVDQYLIDLNATQAAIRAGYSEKSAMEQGYQLLQKTPVKAAIDAALEARSRRTQINADWVLKKAAEIVERCMQEVEPVMVGKGDNRRQLVDEKGRLVFSFDASGATSALNLIAKHQAVDAFAAEKHNHSGNVKTTFDVSGLSSEALKEIVSVANANPDA